MKYCSKCGKKLHDEAVICPDCLCSVSFVNKSNIGNGLKVGALVLMMIQTISFGAIGFISLLYMLFLVFGMGGALAELVVSVIIIVGVLMLPLAYMIPMTLTVNRAIKENNSLSIGFKICVLLLMNLVSGILLLCDSN